MSAGQVELANMKIQLDMANTQLHRLEDDLAHNCGVIDRLKGELTAAEHQLAAEKLISGNLATSTQELLTSLATAGEERDRLAKDKEELEQKAGQLGASRDGLQAEVSRLRRKYEETKRLLKMYVEKHNSCRENHAAARLVGLWLSSQVSN